MERARISAGWLNLAYQYTKVTRGLYVSRERCLEALALTVAKTPRLVVGLTTALWMRGVISVRPNVPWFVLGLRDRIPRWTAQRARFTRSSWPDLATDLQTLDGVPVRVQTAARAAVDCVRCLPADEAAVALKAALAEQVTSTQLLDVAQQTRFSAPMRRFLDGLTP